MRNLDEIEFDTTTVAFTPGEAGRWLQPDPVGYKYERQRMPTDFQGRALARALKNRELVPVSISLARLPNGRKSLIDGQHRLGVIEKGSLSIRLPVVTYYCHTDMEVWEVYKRLDQGRMRTDASILAKDPMFEGLQIKDKEVGPINVGLKWLNYDFKSSGTGRPDNGHKFAHDRLENMRDWLPAAESFLMRLDAANLTSDLRKRLLTGPMPGFFTLICREQPELAFEFISQLAESDVKPCSQPAKAAYSVVTRPPQTKHWQSQSIFQLAECWNAFCDGRDAEVPSEPDHLSGITIAMTKFDGHIKSPYKFVAG